MSDNASSLIVRAPWRDELARVPDLTQGMQRVPAPWNLFALVALPPERIAGIGGIAQGEAGSAFIHFRMRPRFIHQGKGRLLLDAILDKAREWGVGQLQAQVDPFSPEAELLRAFGFDEKRMEEVWKVDLIKTKNRLDRIARKWRKPDDWVVRGIVPDDLPTIAELIAPYNRLSPERLRLREEGEPYGDAYEGYPSSVVESGGELLGALLCKGSGGLNGYIEFRVVGEKYRQYSGILGGLMLHRSVQEALKLDYGSVFFTVNLKTDLETQNLAKRMGGVLTQRIQILSFGLPRTA